MTEKEFIATHAKARAPITVRGKNLKEALEKEGLDPAIWKEVSLPETEDSLPNKEPDKEPEPD